MVHQPDPEKAPDMLAGLVAIRKMHIHAIQESGFTCADEMLYPKTIVISPTFFPTLQWVHVLLRISSIV